jgi:hypothetical protein
MVEELKFLIEAQKDYDRRETQSHWKTLSNSSHSFLRDHGQALLEALVDADRYRWLRQRMSVRREMNMDGEALETLAMRPGLGFLKSTIAPSQGWTMPIFFKEHCEKVDRAIDTARSKTVDGGGV